MKRHPVIWGLLGFSAAASAGFLAEALQPRPFDAVDLGGVPDVPRNPAVRHRPRVLEPVP